MKSVVRILSRYVASAAGVALILLILNLTVSIVWIAQAGKSAKAQYPISEIANSLTKQNGSYILSKSSQKAIKERYQWAMLLSDSGSVIWSMSLPTDVPRSYTVSEVASFTHWYLNDYPVHVWHHPDGLLVLGSAKGSTWKHGIEMSEKTMDNIMAWILGALILNGIAAILLALLFGVRLMRSLKPIAKGIEDMAEKQPIILSTDGLFGDLAKKLNQSSAQLKSQEAALQKRDNARTTWIAGVSHDIRTPLSIVMGYASQLEDNPRLPPSEQEQARIIRRQSEKIKALVSDLNLASKLEYDMQPLRISSVYPAALIREVVTDFLNSGLDEGYSIDVNMGTDAQSIVLTGDEELLRRAVSNLIVNSIRHNPDGCAITVALEKHPSYCKITVFDNGAGFTREVLETLRNPDNPSKLQSHGLGLTIVRQIAKAHSGTAEFRNLPNGGCEAMICLPSAF